MLSGLTDKGSLKEYPLGHFFIAIDPEAFMDLDTFKNISGNILRDLGNSKLAPGEKKIYTAGEKEYIAWQKRKDLGIPLNNSIKQDLKDLNKSLNLKIEFLFCLIDKT